MRNFLKRTWHGIPIGIILTFVVLGAVAASFSFLDGTAEINVEEPCILQTWDGSSWVTRGEGFTISWTDVYPGESKGIPMRVINGSSVALLVTGTYTPTGYPAGGYGDITVSGGFSSGISCSHGTTQDDLALTVATDAPPGTYTFTINFNRS